MDPPSKSKVRRYHVWKGRNVFLCGGRLIFGPDAASVALSTFLIGTPALAFCLKMLGRINETEPSYGYGVLIAGFILLVLDLTFLFMTSGRDPGIVPRSSRPPESDDSSSTASMEWVHTSMGSMKVPRTKDLIVNGHIIKVKYCDTCMIYRPPRCSHCSICNNCVQRFDHHCPWVGQCIGARNYRFYILFISSSTLLCIYVFTFSLVNILQEQGNMWFVMSKDITSVILIVYCFVAVWFVGGLTVFHTYLMCTNQTTYENFRYRYEKKKNPYNMGIVWNLKEVFFSKIPPSLINFRELVTEDEEIYIESIHKFGGLSQKGKFDIEMGGSLRKQGSNQTPLILKNLDLNEVKNNMKEKDKEKDKGGSAGFNSYTSTADQEPQFKRWNSVSGDKNVEDDKNTEDMFHRTSSAFH